MKYRFLSSVVLLHLLAGVCLAGIAAGAMHASHPLRVIISAGAFASVNRNDALASARAWIVSASRARGIDVEVKVDTYATSAELRGIVDQGQADIFVVDVMDYLTLQEQKARWDAYFLPQAGDSTARSYLLLSGSGETTRLKDLRGRKILIQQYNGAIAGRWLEALLREDRLGETRTFFGSSRVVTEPSAAVLPVFFGQADACVVDRFSFEVMKEMNPQLGMHLHEVATSPPFVETVICIQKDYKEFRHELVDGLAQMTDQTAGRQILTVFKVDRLAPFHDEMLNAVRTLRRGPEPVQQAGLR